MPDRIFVDTNILIYFISDDKAKKSLARDIIFSSDNVHVSSQVVSEFVSVCYSKKLIAADEILPLINHLMDAFSFSPVTGNTICEAVRIKNETGYSFWDSQIIAAAIENGCSILYTEDLRDGHWVNDKLAIVNPFR
ncbi:MAG: PIN domain-containing protein [Nitrospirae bacterium]|nr:PIN domain-containing protein [Nitrospirota bacterium]